MRRFMKSSLLLALAITAGSITSDARAWTPDITGVTVTQVITFQNGESRVIVKASSGHYCYFDSEASNGKALMSAVMAAYLSGKQVGIACYDATTNIAGFADTHQLHRFWLR